MLKFNALVLIQKTFGPVLGVLLGFLCRLLFFWCHDRFLFTLFIAFLFFAHVVLSTLIYG